MRITPKEIYAIRDLEVGDKININEHENANPFTLGEILLFDKDGYEWNLHLLYDYEFEKVEDKIWGIDEIGLGNMYHYVNASLNILLKFYEAHIYDNVIIKNSIAFKKEEYAEEYKQKLINFNNEYKKECE